MHFNNLKQSNEEDEEDDEDEDEDDDDDDDDEEDDVKIIIGDVNAETGAYRLDGRLKLLKLKMFGL